MRRVALVTLLAIASPAMADEVLISVWVPGREFRIFPLLEPYRSGTVPLHLDLAAFSDGAQGNGYGGSFGSGHGPGGSDGFGKPRSAVSAMASDSQSSGGGYGGYGNGGAGWGGTTTGPGGLRGGGV